MVNNCMFYKCEQTFFLSDGSKNRSVRILWINIRLFFEILGCVTAQLDLNRLYRPCWIILKQADNVPSCDDHHLLSQPFGQHFWQDEIDKVEEKVNAAFLKKFRSSELDQSSDEKLLVMKVCHLVALITIFNIDLLTRNVANGWPMPPCCTTTSSLLMLLM